MDKIIISSIQEDLTTSLLGSKILLYPKLPSTNTEAKRLVKEGAKEGTVILAETQSSGKGRMGRPWYSPKGKNLYLSVILHPRSAARNIPWLGLASAVALVRVIEQELALTAHVKWPNDVYISRYKVAGILTEAVFQNSQIESVILGIGVNVNMREQDFPPELRAIATSLKIQSHRSVDRTRFLQKLLGALDEWYGIFLRSSFEEIRRAYLTHFELLNQPVRIQQAKKTIYGTVTGISHEGALIIRQQGGLETKHHSGDVSHVRITDAVGH